MSALHCHQDQVLRCGPRCLSVAGRANRWHINCASSSVYLTDTGLLAGRALRAMPRISAAMFVHIYRSRGDVFGQTASMYGGGMSGVNAQRHEARWGSHIPY
jgi:hypothetical protein